MGVTEFCFFSLRVPSQFGSALLAIKRWDGVLLPCSAVHLNLFDFTLCVPERFSHNRFPVVLGRKSRSHRNATMPSQALWLTPCALQFSVSPGVPQLGSAEIPFGNRPLLVNEGCCAFPVGFHCKAEPLTCDSLRTPIDRVLVILYSAGFIAVYPNLSYSSACSSLF